MTKCTILFFLCWPVLFCNALSLNADSIRISNDTGATSTQREAIAFIDSITSLEKSDTWPSIKPDLFLKNLQQTIHDPAGIYPGRETNFCGYGALTYLMLQDDPLGYAKLLLKLYKEGKADFGKARFRPSAAIRLVAGRLRFKGVLDIRPAEQLWYLCLADHYKGYLNFFNRKYDPGDENTMWAAVNYAKFNRMVRQLLHYKVNARGSDLIRPSIRNREDYINEKIKTGTVVLFLNNRILHKKKLEKIRVAVPTHFVIVQQLYKTDGVITMQYWDYGSKTLRQMTPYSFRKIIFGISYCTKKTANEK